MLNKIFKAMFCFLLSMAINKPSDAQAVYIPDSDVRDFLMSEAPGCFDDISNTLDTTCASSISISYAYLFFASDLYGLQFFNNIDTLHIYNACLFFADSLKNIPYCNVLYLEEFECTGITSFPEGIKDIDINYDYNTASLPTFPDSLTRLSLQYSNINIIPSVPAKLRSLTLYSTNITSLPILPNELNYLFTTVQQQLTSLPDSLRFLSCSGTGSTTLPILPDSLEHLDCAGNNMSIIPNLPNNLEFLNCSDNNLVQLPTLPAPLYLLYCSNNNLNSLPALSPNLKYLNMEFNNIDSLPYLPSKIKYMYINDNNINIINNFPDSLEYLIAKNNLIESIPNFPSSTYNVDLSNNNLLSCPSFPQSLALINLKNNPNLFCLPALNKVNNIQIANTGITCLPQVKPINVYIDVTGLPLCGLFNTNGCDFYWNLGGQSFLDKDTNCLLDTVSNNLKYLKIKLTDNNNNLLQQVYTNQDGAYSFDTDALGVYKVKVDTAGLPFNIVCPQTAGYTSTLIPSDSLDLGLDFAFECMGNDLQVKSIFTESLRPGITKKVYNIINDAAAFYGVNCSSGLSGEVKVILNGPVSYAYPSATGLTPTSINGDTIIYQVADFNQTINNNSFCFFITVDTLAQATDTVCISVLVTSNGNEQNINNNYLSNCFSIVNSYDPNDKNSYPQTYIDKSGDGWINYTIRFQNTGTAEAINIYVTDTIDASLDISSFEILATSHDHITQILQNNVVKFNFPNINLPDSISDEPGSHGFIQYRIKIKDSLAVGLTINNTANIYFDLNPPVITNTISNSVINCAIPETQINATICDGNDFIFDGLTYTNSGNYKRSYVTNVGCDSTVNLSINVIGGTSGVNLVRNGNTLSTTLGASSYQWINCNTGLPIPGATGPSYTVLNSGYYSLYTSNGICADTSDCFYFSLTGINELSNINITVFPNPFSNEFTVKTNDSKLYELQLFDQQGKLIEKKMHQNETKLDTKNLSSGLYFVRLINNESVQLIKVMKL